MTCSDDGKIKVWDALTKKLIKSINLNLDKTGAKVPIDPFFKNLNDTHMGRAIDVNPKGDLIAVGLKDGSLRVFQN